MASITLTLSGSAPQLHSQYFPPIDLSDGEYVCGLVDLQTYNSIPNVNKSNSILQFDFGANRPGEIDIPTGTYEVDDLAKYLETELKERFDINFKLITNKNTLTTTIRCSATIDFTVKNTIGPLLGFSRKVLAPGFLHFSNRPVDILKVNVIRVECNIAKGSYINGIPAHTIHEFSPRVPPGYKISEVPNNVIYYPITIKSISTLDISLIDQDNDLIDFRGERITIRVHIKRIESNKSE